MCERGGNVLCTVYEVILSSISVCYDCHTVELFYGSQVEVLADVCSKKNISI